MSDSKSLFSFPCERVSLRTSFLLFCDTLDLHFCFSSSRREFALSGAVTSLNQQIYECLEGQHGSVM